MLRLRAHSEVITYSVSILEAHNGHLLPCVFYRYEAVDTIVLYRMQTPVSTLLMVLYPILETFRSVPITLLSPRESRKWATSEVEKDNDEVNHEVFKSENENVLGVHDNEEEEIAFLDGLLEDDNFFEINDKKVEFLERKIKEDSETKVELEKKKELQVFHPDIDVLNHFETTFYVGSDYVFYEDFNLVDMIFPMNIPGKIFDPGITFHGKSFVKDDKSSKELAPSKALLTLDIFDPLHPPLMDFHVTKAFSGFTFSLLKIFSKKFVEPGIKNAKERITRTKEAKTVKNQQGTKETRTRVRNQPKITAGSTRHNKKGSQRKKQ
ncbi:hypothetical protein Tco_0161521 [Tanacetum coccineum]